MSQAKAMLVTHPVVLSAQPVRLGVMWLVLLTKRRVVDHCRMRTSLCRPL
jgi:hypothetical protein